MSAAAMWTSKLGNKYPMDLMQKNDSSAQKESFTPHTQRQIGSVGTGYVGVNIRMVCACISYIYMCTYIIYIYIYIRSHFGSSDIAISDQTVQQQTVAHSDFK